MKSLTRGHWLGVALLVSLSLVAGCSGGGTGLTSSAPPGASAAGTTAATLPSRALRGTNLPAKRRKLGKARFVIEVPRKKKLGRRMNPEYISSSTKSMTVGVQGGTTQTFNLTASSSNCSTDQTTGYLTCTEAAKIPGGQQTLIITLYDQKDGQGDALATATTSVSIASTGFTTIPITLGGVVATAKVLLNGGPTAGVPVGTPTSVPVAVEAYDAGGNLIVPPGNYSSPITLTNSDPSGVTSFSSPAPGVRRLAEHRLKPFDMTTIGTPGESQTLYYSGGFLAVSTITPSVGGTPQPAGGGTLNATGTLIQEFSVPTPGSGLHGITAGPDGALWFTESAQNFGQVGRITTSGKATEYSFTFGSNAAPWDIVTGPDGNLWFTAENGSSSLTLGKITTSGTETGYNVGGPTQGLIVGADGNLWFTVAGSEEIGKSTTSGTATLYSTGPSNTLVAGPDGALWYGVPNYLVRLTTSGSVTGLYSTVTDGDAPQGLVTGPDGALWGTFALNQSILRVTTAGTTTAYAIPSPAPPKAGLAALGGIIVGPDGAIWFAGSAGGYIGRIATDGTITEYSVPLAGSEPLNLTIGPAPVALESGNAVWFTDPGTNQIGVVL